MNLNFLTTPVPHEEARRAIAGKPAVVKEVFDRLPDEMKSRAFTITGIEDFDVLQAVRDEIATIPAGADWEKVKKSVIAKISPWFTEEGAAARAETLMSHHAFAAYSSTQARIMDAMIDVFPFRQYLSTKDGKVRASHAALHGIILPANHVFWTYHTPPWEWNCRCQVVELTQEDRDEEYRKDHSGEKEEVIYEIGPGGKEKTRMEARLPENRRVLEGSALKQLDQGSLNRGLSTNVDVRTPKERGGNYQWSARDTTLPYEEIKTRWDAQTAADFETWAGKQAVGLDNLLDVLQGKAVFRSRKPARKLAGGVANLVEFSENILKGAAVSQGEAGMVSRMAAVDAAKVTTYEDSIRLKRIEHGMGFDAEGNEKWTREGSRDRLPLPDGDLTGTGATHNHPDGTSFSPDDLEVLYSRALAEIRAATYEGTYSMRKVAGKRLSQIQGRLVVIQADLNASLAVLEKAGTFTPAQIEQKFYHLQWSKLAEEGLISYDYTPMNPRSNEPLKTALSAQDPQTGPPPVRPWDAPTILYTPPASEIRDVLDGKTEITASLARSMERVRLHGEPWEADA